LKRDSSGQHLLYAADEKLVRALEPAGQAIKVERDARVFSVGDAARGVFLILKGMARATLTDEGRELMCRVAGPGSVLGLPSALCSKHYQYDVRALEPVEAVFLETAAMNDILRGHPDLCMRAMRMMCEEMDALRQTREHMNNCGQETCALFPQCSQRAGLD